MKSLRSLLIFPPFWEPTQPYLAIPALTAWLRSQGYPVQQWDLNLDFHDTVISTAYLDQMLAQRCSESHIQGLPTAQFRQYFLPLVDQAKAILRSSDYYLPQKFVHAKSVLERAYELLSLGYAPSQCSKRGMMLPYRESSSAELLLASQDEAANPFLDFYRQHALPQIAADPPDLLGISIADATQLVAGLTLARLVRERWPEIHITLGGALFSKFAAALVEQGEPAFSHFFHSVISGEGELPLLKLIEALQGQHSFEDVPGLVWRDETGQVQRNEIGLPIPMNDLPLPDFDDLPLDRYWVPEPILPLLGSKDCYWKDCTFCDHYVSYAPRYRMRKPSLMAEDMACLQQKHGVRQFSFGDETLSPTYAQRLATALIDRGLDLRWSILSRLQKEFDAETCKLIRAGGCSFIMYGLESAHPRTIERMAKGTDPELAATVYRHTDAAGIYNYSFIFFGFPGETRAEAQTTVDFVTAQRPWMHSIGAGYFFLQKFAPIFRNRQHYGITMVSEQDLLDDWSISIRYELTEGLSQSEAAAFYQDFITHLKGLYGMPLWLLDNSRSTLFLYLNHHGIDWMKNYDFSGQARVTALA